jgi:hypothetical protein
VLAAGLAADGPLRLDDHRAYAPAAGGGGGGGPGRFFDGWAAVLAAVPAAAAAACEEMDSEGSPLFRDPDGCGPSVLVCLRNPKATA